MVVEAGSGGAGVGHVVITVDTGAVITLIDGWEYLEQSEITRLSTADGQFGTEVNIVGTNLLGGADRIVKVTLAGATAEITSGTNDTVLKVIAPYATPRQGDVLVKSNQGAETVLVNGWQFNARGNVSVVSPSSGHYGTEVTIDGQELLGGGSSVRTLTLGGVLADVQTADDSRIVAIIDHGAPQYDLAGNVSYTDVVIVSNTGAQLTGVQMWTYVEEGVVDSITPSSGQFGTRVTLQGSGLLGGGSEVVSVTLAGENGRNPTGDDSTITLVAPEASDFAGVVVIVSDTGAIVTSTDDWTFIEAGQIVSVAPNSGQHGARVTITGSNLLGGSSQILSATLNGLETVIDSQTNEQLVVIVPVSSSSGAVDIVLVAKSGAVVTGSSLWQFTEPAVVAPLSPAFGQFKSSVEITGSNLRTGANEIVSVTLSGVEVLEIVSESETLIEIVAASGPVGLGDVVITSDSGSFVVAEASFKYHEEGEIVSTEPNSGVLGTRVTLHGTNPFGGGNEITELTRANIFVESIDFQNNTMVVVTAANATA